MKLPIVFMMELLLELLILEMLVVYSERQCFNSYNYVLTVLDTLL